MKKILSVLIFIFVFLSAALISYANTDAKARALIQKAHTAKTNDAKYEYLHKAKDLYLQDYEEDPSDIGTLVGLSEIFALLQDRKNSKVYILQAYNIHPEYPFLQKKMGDFYYSFQEYSTAIEYYKLALSNGLLRDYETNIKTAQCYEKLGDEANAELYYSISAHVNPSSRTASNMLNSYSSERKIQEDSYKKKPKYYYLFKKPEESQEKESVQDTENIIKDLQERN